MTKNALAPRTYAELRRGVENALLVGQRQIEAAKVHTYWETGRLISEHLRLHEQRPEYGAEIMRRLANDLKTSDTVLYRCVRFAQSFPILATWPKLSWAHYRMLIPVEAPAQRKDLERSAIKHGWTCVELDRHIRPLRPLNGASGIALSSGSNRSRHESLTPKRGTVGLYRVVGNGDSLAVDLGFTSYLDLTEAQAVGLKADSLVRLESNGKIATAKNGSRNGRTGETPIPLSIAKTEDASTSELFTYRAEVIRVVDGDTLWMKIHLLPKLWLKEKLRLRGLDCPEMDTPEGRHAKLFVEKLVSQASSVTITTTKPDKYDRYLSDIFLETEAGAEMFLNNLLLENGHAVRKDSYEVLDWEAVGGVHR